MNVQSQNIRFTSIASKRYSFKRIIKGMSILFYILISFTTSAQTLKIFSEENNKPLQGVEVYVAEQAKTYISSRNGIINIDTKQKQIACYIYASGFKTEVFQFDFSKDTLKYIFLEKWAVELTEVEIIRDREEKLKALQLKNVEGMMINASKKTERITIEELPANTSTNNSRQIYAKVPGLNIWESHGSGVNTEIGARGLSPIRSSNF